LLSIVIPTLNEVRRIELLARHLAAVVPDAEIVLVDGGSTDGTGAAAEGVGLRVIRPGTTGRGAQMNAGVEATTGDQLLFLHADTDLPVGAERAVADALADPDVAIGAFAVRLDHRSPGLAIIELGIHLRSRYGRMPYGDQALFCRRPTFDALGGYRTDLALMEDADLVRRAKTLGRVEVLDREVVTSARRWREHGVLKVTAWNWWMTARFLSRRL